jgi:hypothetical protein
LVFASIVVFFVVVPVVYTSRFAYMVYPSNGCSDVCSQICYVSLSYHFFGVGGLVCHYENEVPFYPNPT